MTVFFFLYLCRSFIFGIRCPLFFFYLNNFHCYLQKQTMTMKRCPAYTRAILFPFSLFAECTCWTKKKNFHLNTTLYRTANNITNDIGYLFWWRENVINSYVCGCNFGNVFLANFSHYFHYERFYVKSHCLSTAYFFVHTNKMTKEEIKLEIGHCRNILVCCQAFLVQSTW